MGWALHQLLLGIHILLAIVWMGGVLFIGGGIYPVIRTMPFNEQRHFLRSLMNWTHRVFTAAGSGVILTGILLGTGDGGH